MGYPNYPQQPPQSGPQPGYPPQPGYVPPTQPGYAPQGYPASWPQAPAPAYGPPPGYPPAPAQPGYDWNQLHDTADFTGGPRGTMDKGEYPAVVNEAEWETASTGNGMWRIQFVFTDGQYAGWKRTFRVVVAPFKKTGEPNPKGMGATFRRLGVLGIPAPKDAPQLFPPPGTPPEQQAPFMARIAQMMLGRPVMVIIGHEEYPEGSGQWNDTVTDIRELQGQVPPQAAPQAVQYAQPQPMGGPGGGQPSYGPTTGGPGYGPPTGQVAPQPWQQVQQPPAPQGPPPQPQYAGAPAAPQPGPGGVAEFASPAATPNGQAAQQVPQGPPSPVQPPWTTGQQ